MFGWVRDLRPQLDFVCEQHDFLGIRRDDLDGERLAADERGGVNVQNR